MRRIVGVVAMATGSLLLGFTAGEHLFARARDAQVVADRYRSQMSAAGLAELRAGFDQLRAAGTQLATQAEPALQRSLGLDDAAFAAYEQQQMPSVTSFDQKAGAIVGLVDPVITRMQASRADYHQADQIPASFLPLDSAPWLFTGIGVGLVVLGVIAVIERRRRPLSVLLLGAAGIALVAAPLVLGIPGKIDAAIRVKEIGRAGLAPATGRAAVGATALFDGVAHDVVTVLGPQLAAHGSSLATDFPVLDGWVHQWQDGISAKSHALSDSQVALAGTFADADRIPLRIVPWLFIGPGALLVVLSGAALARRRGRYDSVGTDPAGRAAAPAPVMAAAATSTATSTSP